LLLPACLALLLVVQLLLLFLLDLFSAVLVVYNDLVSFDFVAIVIIE
jgi:hypothetical protein